jgi:hypothetical protein
VAVDCLYSPDLVPNGPDGDRFCQKGLPFDDPAFVCDDVNGVGRCRECWLDADGLDLECGFGQQCDDTIGMCVDIVGCPLAEANDEFEGSPETAKEVTGAGQHLWARTLHLDDSSTDIDYALLYLDESDIDGAYSLMVYVRNDCWVGEDPWEPMQELSIRVEQKESGPGESYVELIHWPEVEGYQADGWAHPNRYYGVSIPLDTTESEALLSKRPLRVSVRNDPDTPESVKYTMGVYLGTTYIPDWSVVFEPVFPAFLTLVPGIILRQDGDPGRVSSVAISRTALDGGEADGTQVFFRPDDPDPNRTTTMVLFNQRGTAVRTAVPKDGGMAVDLTGLVLADGPYVLRMQSPSARMTGDLYLCPDGATRDCSTFDPSRQGCGGQDCGAGESCCRDFESGAVVCSDPLADEMNCGGCGVVCEWDETCVRGVCAEGLGTSCWWNTTCPDGTWCCPDKWLSGAGPKCKALLDDDDNCGWCGHACAAGLTCVSGLCLPRNRQPCDLACGPGESCCWVLGTEQCVDTDSSLLSCGSCSTVCECGNVCDAGRCVPWLSVYDPCPFGLRNCGTGGEIDCVNVVTNHTHCGRCRNTCSDTASCEGGHCISEPAEGAPEEEWEVEQ